MQSEDRISFEDRLRRLRSEEPPEVEPLRQENSRPHYEADPNFLKFKREFYLLQYEFFMRAPEPSGECLNEATCGKPGGRYTDASGEIHYTGSSSSLCKNCREWADWEIAGACYKYLAENPDNDTNIRLDDKCNLREFSIRVNVKSTMEQIDEEIIRQVQEIKRRLLDEKTSKTVLRDWLRTKQGSRRPTGKKDTFKMWEKCLQAYDLRKTGEPWENIGHLICGDSYKTQDPNRKRRRKPKNTLTRDARDLVEEAERLIESAVRGTFPD